ncbi:MAG TPA: T9SS type A sorting domain-containing protein [Chitinophagaceae bacterium]
MGRWRVICAGLMFTVFLGCVPFVSVALQRDSTDSVKVYAVPGRNKLIISIREQGTVRTTFQLVDADGKVHRQKTAELKPGANTVTLHFNCLATGTYFIRIIQQDRIRTLKIIIGTEATRLSFNEFLNPQL